MFDMQTLMLELFLSIQAQDFIEDCVDTETTGRAVNIPEHSSSGLH